MVLSKNYNLGLEVYEGYKEKLKLHSNNNKLYFLVTSLISMCNLQDIFRTLIIFVREIFRISSQILLWQVVSTSSFFFFRVFISQTKRTCNYTLPVHCAVLQWRISEGCDRWITPPPPWRFEWFTSNTDYGDMVEVKVYDGEGKDGNSLLSLNSPSSFKTFIYVSIDFIIYYIFIVYYKINDVGNRH